MSVALVNDTKAILRRYILHKLNKPLKRNSSGYSWFEKGFRQSVMSAKLHCTLRTVQFIFRDINKHFMSGEVIQLTNLDFIPSLLSILNPDKSVPYIHVLFQIFAHLCDYFNITDINDIEQCLCRIAPSSASPKILRVLGVHHHSKSNRSMY